MTVIVGEAIPSEHDSRTQLHGIAQAKPEAFHRFFGDWQPRVYRYASRRVGAVRAEVVCERVLMRTITESSRAPEDRSVAEWLLVMVKEELASVAR